ncbi:MAG TPA: 2-oxoacid:acceptor oxidoreductase family protein [Candidatus Limnocylindrales bacterium]|jgi:2-oxoglutarate ferredoxin oxidoreductase subunit gamma
MNQGSIFAGFGGQGLLFCGHVLAEAALLEGRHVTWMPSYGPEMRGGTASCTVVVSDHPIGSPILDRADAVVALNPPSLARFESVVAPNGLLILNTSLIEAEPSRTDIRVLALPCTSMASLLGDVRLASVVALGGLIADTPIVRPESVRRALAEIVGAKRREILDADLAAFERGYELAAPVSELITEVYA